MVSNEKLNLTMLCDFYELTMGNGYFENGFKDRICYFDVFFRQCPDGGGFAIAAGLEQIIDYIKNLHFAPEDIAYLRVIPGVLGRLPLHRRHLGSAGGYTHFSQGAHYGCSGPGH